MIEICSAKLLTDRFKVEGKLYKWMIEGDTQPLPCCRFRHGLCGCAPWRPKNFESRRSLKINRVRTVRLGPGFIVKEVGVPLPNRLGKPWVLPLVGRSADERKKTTCMLARSLRWSTQPARGDAPPSCSDLHGHGKGCKGMEKAAAQATEHAHCRAQRFMKRFSVPRS